MSTDHKLTACANRAHFQLKRAASYLDLVTTVIPEDDDDPNRQFLYQTMVLMVQSFFEEYLRCVLALGSFWKTADVRAHPGEAYQEAARFDVMPAAEVGKVVQNRVSSDDKAAKLRAVIRVLVGVDPFADPNVEARCVDFANVRNIIAHRGGWPDEANAPTVICGSPHGALVAKFGAEKVFMDQFSIELGNPFDVAIQQAITHCSVVVAVIGGNWSSILSSDVNGRRLDDYRDYVRRELVTALDRGTTIVPLLAPGASVLRYGDRLPDEMQGLELLQALQLTSKHWDADVAELIKKIEDEVRKAESSSGESVKEPVASVSDATPVLPQKLAETRIR